jgi:hypothetical protein
MLELPFSPEAVMSRALRCCALLIAAPLFVSCSAAPRAAAETTAADLLYVWTGDGDHADADFLAVFDADPASPDYGQLVATVPVEGRANFPHHTEYALDGGSTLFANAWGSGRTFVFDVSQPLQPRVSAITEGQGGYTYPHSYARLPNGNVLATFQSRAGSYTPPGGLVELDRNGAAVRGVSGAVPGLPLPETWPYSLLVLPELDRLVTTNTRMGIVAEWFDTTHVHAGADAQSPYVQVWRLSDLTPLSVLELPPQDGGHNAWPAEPRRLANGDVYINTFSCGLYRIDGLDTAAPSIVPVLHSPFDGSGYCAVPVVLGNFWIQPSATERAIVAYDLRDRASPREASRLELDAAFVEPHWIALDPGAPRIVVTAEQPGWMLLIDVDPETGALSIDERFRDRGATRPGVWFDRADWPHGASGRAHPHGAVFRPRP